MNNQEMRILYVYDKMPGVYQHYLSKTLGRLKNLVCIKTLAYENNSDADYSIVSTGFIDKILNFKNRIGLSTYKRNDLKIMNSYDLIHLQHSNQSFKIKPLFSKQNKPKIVITLRGGDTYMYPWVYKHWEELYTEASSFIDAFVVMSAHQKEYLSRWGVEENKIHVIPISFGNESHAKPKYPNEKTLKLISAFRMTWEKNIEGCIRFALTLRDKKIPFTYDFYGDGKDLTELFYLVDKFNLKDQVNIHGKISNETLIELLPDYDFFVQLSLSEALSASIIEAQSVGLPCIVSNSDGLPEAVLAGESAIVNDYYNIEEMASDCIALWNDKERYYKFSEASIKNARAKFSTEAEANKLQELYSSLLIG